jgi:hypothetical protein
MTNPFKDYKPEVVEYDEELDGGGEHLIRDDLMNEKEMLKAKITKAKAARKGNQTNYRQPIRTENEAK